MTNVSKIYSKVTDKIVAQIEAGVLPWNKPWAGARGIAGHEYTGINALITGTQDFESPFWITFKQAKERGGNVIKGEKGTSIILWLPFVSKDKETDEKSSRLLVKYYTVFNLDQTEGVEAPTVEENTNEPIETAAAIIEGYAKHGGPPVDRAQAAYYRPSSDTIGMPEHTRFNTSESYYATLFHEEAHSTGHPDRLHRFDKADKFGSEPYSKEELVAELTAAMLCAQAGIEKAIIDNSASYIAGWLKRLQDDRRLIVLAAQAAQKAANYINGIERNNKDD